MFKFLGGIIAGATYPARSLILLCSTPRLQKYIVIPILFNIIIGATAYIGLLTAGWQGIDILLLNLSLPDWANTGITLPVVEWLLRFVLSLLLLLATGFLMVQFGVLLGAPWYGKLSEQLELLRLGTLPAGEPFTPTSVFKDVQRALLFELKKLMLLAGFGLPLLALGFVPPVGSLIASVGGVTLSATLLCLDFFDSPLERRRLPFRVKLNIIRRNLPASGTFGLVCWLLVSVPILNLFTIPLCVASGTLFFCDRIFPQLSDRAEQELPAKDAL